MKVTLIYTRRRKAVVSQCDFCILAPRTDAENHEQVVRI